MAYARRVHSARRHDCDAEFGHDQRFEITIGIDFVRVVEANPHRIEPLGFELGQIGSGVNQEPRVANQFDVQIDLIVHCQRVIGPDDKIEGFTEHRPGLQPIPAFAHWSADRQIDRTVLEHRGNLRAGAAPQFELKPDKAAVHLAQWTHQMDQIERPRHRKR